MSDRRTLNISQIVESIRQEYSANGGVIDDSVQDKMDRLYNIINEGATNSDQGNVDDLQLGDLEFLDPVEYRKAMDKETIEVLQGILSQLSDIESRRPLTKVEMENKHATEDFLQRIILDNVQGG